MIAIDTIVVPQGAEYQAICRGLKSTNLENIQVIAIPIGAGQSDRILSYYSKTIDNATGILIAGLSGSLSATHTVGDSVLIGQCQDWQHRQVNLDRQLSEAIEQKLSLSSVTALTSNRIITQSQEKLLLARQYSAAIVEMEGYDYITALQKRGKKLAMLRTISDDLKSNLPDLNRAIDHQGNLNYLPMAIAFIRQPIAAANLIRGSWTGLNRLEQIIARLFAA